MKLTRRAVTAGLATLGALTMGGFGSARAETKLRMVWWGAQDRARRTFAALEAYQKAHPGVAISGDTLGWPDYWPRLATQIAGGNGPDLIQQDYRLLSEYARRGSLLVLDPFVPKPINLSDTPKSVIDSGKVDGKLYAVSLGTNTMALVYDRDVFDEAKVQMPDWSWDWSKYAELATAISKATKNRVYGTSDGGAQEEPLEVFLRQRGKALYTADGKLAFVADDIAEWFDFWDKLRKAGGAPPAEIQAISKGSNDTNLLVLGKAAMVFEHSNLLVAYQSSVKHKLGVNMYPQGPKGAQPGQYLKPSQLISGYAKTGSPEIVAEVIDFLTRAPEAVKALGVERGIPASSGALKVLLPELSETEKLAANYVEMAGEHTAALPPPPPKGAGEIQQAVRRANEAVGFGQGKPSEVAKNFYDEAQKIVARS